MTLLNASRHIVHMFALLAVLHPFEIVLEQYDIASGYTTAGARYLDQFPIFEQYFHLRR
jgi:hypothetical protein